MKDGKGEENDDDCKPEKKGVASTGNAERMYGKICSDPFQTVRVRWRGVHEMGRAASATFV